MTYRKRAFGVVLAVLIVSVAVTASAVDRKSYHGALCQPRLVEHKADLVFDENGVTNTHPSSTRYVTCPLIRDSIGSSDQINSVRVELFVVDATPNFSKQCTLYTQPEDNTPGMASTYIWDFQQGAVSGTGFQEILFDDIGTTGGGNTNGNEGSYSLFCFLASGDTLLHSYVVEN